MTARHNRQRGAALIVGLVLLMVLTVLAISAMRTATLDLAMSGNTQFRENAFQLAESGVQSVIRGVESGAINLDDAAVVGNCPPPPPLPRQIWTNAELPWSLPPVRVDLDDTQMHGQYQTRICMAGETTDMPGSSPGLFRQLHYRIEARGRTDQRNAEAIHAQGFYRQIEG